MTKRPKIDVNVRLYLAISVPRRINVILKYVISFLNVYIQFYIKIFNTVSSFYVCEHIF